MKATNYKTLFAVVGAALLSAATLISSQSLKSALAFEKKLGQDVAGKNCERIDTPESSTFGKCENVCKDKEVTRDAVNDRWVCKASRVVGNHPRVDSVPIGGTLQYPGADPQKGKAKADVIEIKKAREKESSELKAQVNKAPEGVVIRGDKITLKAGYQFEKPSGNTVAVARDNGGITGKFSCDCLLEKPSAVDCNLHIFESTATCAGSCKDNCILHVIVNPKAAPFNKAEIKVNETQIQTAPLKKAKN